MLTIIFTRKWPAIGYVGVSVGLLCYTLLWCFTSVHFAWFDSFYVRVSTMTVIWTVGHILKCTPKNGHRFTELGLP